MHRIMKKIIPVGLLALAGLILQTAGDLRAQAFFRSESDGYHFGNGKLERVFERKDSLFRSTWLVNRITGHTWRLDSEEFRFDCRMNACISGRAWKILSRSALPIVFSAVTGWRLRDKGFGGWSSITTGNRACLAKSRKGIGTRLGWRLRSRTRYPTLCRRCESKYA